MKRTLQIFAVAAALAFCGMTGSAQETSHAKAALADAQSDSSRGMYDNDGTSQARRHPMDDSTRTKTMKRGSRHDTVRTHTAPDNTRRNKRDTTKTHLTPMDQGGKSEDVEMTRKIRAEIMKQKGFSVNARNVKIITVDGHVTLRGPVKTEDEKMRIAEIAEKVASSGNVDNQLEVKVTSENK